MKEADVDNRAKLRGAANLKRSNLGWMSKFGRGAGKSEGVKSGGASKLGGGRRRFGVGKEQIWGGQRRSGGGGRLTGYNSISNI